MGYSCCGGMSKSSPNPPATIIHRQVKSKVQGPKSKAGIKRPWTLDLGLWTWLLGAEDGCKSLIRVEHDKLVFVERADAGRNQRLAVQAVGPAVELFAVFVI